jgi:hypothetical protein
MLAASVPFAKGLGLHLALCLVSLLAGRGLLRLLGARTDERAEPVLASVLTYAVWSIVLGLASAFSCPLRLAAPAVWVASGLLALNGLRGPRPTLRGGLFPWAACVLLPVAVMAQSFRAGITDYTGTLDCDGFTYAAEGHHQWEYGRASGYGTVGRLSPIDQFGAALAGERYLTGSLLAFLSPLARPGDAFAVEPLLQAYALFTAGCAVYLFCVADRFAPGVALAATGMTVFSGWMANVVWANNLDNTLAVVYMPALAGVFRLWGPGDWRRWLGTALLAACSFYTYPECACFVLAGAGLVLLPRAWEERHSWRLWLRWGAAALALAALLALPAARMVLHVARGAFQVSLRPPGQRPGDPWFAGLLDRRYQPTCFWALGGETLAKPYHAGLRAVAIALSALLVVGLIRLVGQRRWGLAVATLTFLGGAFYVLLHHRYEYGAYKLFVLGWWCVAAATVTGLDWFVRRTPTATGRRALAAGLAAGALALGFRVTATTTTLCPSSYHAVQTSAFREVRALGAQAGGRGILLAVDDWVPNLLAVYYLWERPLYIACPRCFLVNPGPGAEPRLARLPPLEQIEYVLTDDGRGKPADGKPWDTGMRTLCRPGRLVGARGPYRLWKAEAGPAGAALVFVFNLASGVQKDAQGAGYFWMVDDDAVVYLMAARDGTAELAGDFVTGPSRPGESTHHLRVRTDAGQELRAGVSSGRSAFTVPVHGGMNRICLHVLDRPTAPDPTPVLLGVWSLSARLTAPGGTEYCPGAKDAHKPEAPARGHKPEAPARESPRWRFGLVWFPRWRFGLV